MSIILNPSEEGITHINIYSKSNLEVGRLMSNFYKSRIYTPEGIFMSVEAYWHYLLIPDGVEAKKELLDLYGYNAKSKGTELLKKYGKKDVPDFEEKISDAISRKLMHHRDILFEKEEYLYLPLEHYYNFNGRIVDAKNKYLWFVKNISYIRGWLIDNLWGVI